jgi:hypothetical protein
MVYFLLLVLRRLPFDPFEVEYKNCVEDRDQSKVVNVGRAPTSADPSTKRP